MAFAGTVVAGIVVLGIAWRYLGHYMTLVYEGQIGYARRFERVIYRLLGVDPDQEQRWNRYAISLVVFSGVCVAFTYGLLRLQGHLALNPNHEPGVSPSLALNTAVSFVTNTNWQNYSGETTMSYLSQMAVLGLQMFVSASVGVAVAVALIRGISRRHASTIGNFWVDLVRGVLYVFLPISFVAAIIFMAQGAVQTFGANVHVTDPLNGFAQVIARGPVASMEVIKELGTNGGGYFNANGAHPFENPTGLTNFLSIILILSVPVALTRVFGEMVGRIREGVFVLGVMASIFVLSAAIGVHAELGANAAVHAGGLAHQAGGNMVGKEVRFGAANSALYNITSTQTSTGSVNSTMDSYTPVGSMMALVGMMLGEVSPGGVGSGLYTYLLFAIVAVFLAGLMVGRTPEYLGKKIQAREMKVAAFGVLVMPLTVLILTGVATAIHQGTGQVLNHGPHGFSEVLYAFVSQGNNNGSAFAGLNGNTAFYNIAGAIAMALGRFVIIIPALCLGGLFAAQGQVPITVGTLRSDTVLFASLVLGVIVVVGGLTFLPALSLGSLAEALSHGRLF